MHFMKQNYLHIESHSFPVINIFCFVYVATEAEGGQHPFYFFLKTPKFLRDSVKLNINEVSRRTCLGKIPPKPP